jgi:hypothetical protein
VDHRDRVLITKADAGVNNHLRPPLHLGVATLHTGEVELCGLFSGGIARRGTASETNKHGRATKDDGVCAVENILGMFEGMLRSDSTNTTCNHDGLVVATPLGGALVTDIGQESSETSEKTGSTEFVVEPCTANRCFHHDVETAGKVSWAPKIDFPGCFLIGDKKLGYPETAETSLGS